MAAGTAATLLAGLLALAGCDVMPGGRDSGGADSGADGGRKGGGTAADGGGTAEKALTEVTVNRSVWHRGFKITVGTARLVEPRDDNGGRVVAIEATFQNLSPEEDDQPSRYLVVSSGQHSYDEPAGDLFDVPEVPALRSRTGVIAIEVDERFTLADAALTFGEPTERQAVVPLAREAGLVSLEPRTVKAGGKLLGEGNDAFFLTVTGVEVRADNPYQHIEAKAGKDFFGITFTATNDSSAGFAWVFERDLNLRLPDGTKIGHSSDCSRGQVYAAAHSTVSGGYLCFEVPAPATGDYTLIWDNVEKRGLPLRVT
jgi:hypothetical protein